MNRNEESAAYEAQVAVNKEILKETHAHQMQDLKLLLSLKKQFITKLHMVFKKRDKESRSIKRSIYGNEHSVTYSQCLFHKVDCIVLDRKKGYYDLVRYVEQDLKGQYIECKLYYDDGSGNFNKLCRKWHKGGLVLKEDPEFSDEDVKVLYFTVKNSRLHITEKPEESEVQNTDFKQLVSEALK